VIFHAATLQQLRWILAETTPFPEAPAILPALVAISLALAVAMLVARNRLPFRVLLVLRFAVLLVFGYSLDGHLLAHLTLLVPLVIETAVYEAWPWNLAFSSGIVLAGLALRGIEAIGRTAGPESLLSYVLYGLAFALCASLGAFYRESMIRDRAQLEALRASIQNLTRASMGYMDMASAAGERSTLAERNRISRELHDTIGYTFTNLIMMMEAATDLAEKDPAEMRQTMQTARRQAEQGLTEVRRALYALREREVPREVGLAAIVRLVRLFELATHVTVKTEFGNVPASCGEEIDSALYHFVQEGLTNSFRHGRATHVDLIFWRDGDDITVTLRDNGSGAGEIDEGIGIRGMRERFGKLGGTIDAGSFPGGFRLVAELPLPL
jgi:signal transduction histidine kinase